MLFINNLRNATRKDVVWIHVLPTLIVFVAFFGVTLWSWQTTKARVKEQKEQAITQEVGRIESRILDRMGDYQQILESANGLFQASEDVNRAEWRAFYENYDIPNRYPGLQGIAFAERVPRGQLSTHEKQVRAEGFTDYQVTPSGARPVYVPIIYPVSKVTPQNYKDLTGFGFDIASDETRRQALDSASKSKEVALTGKLTLIGDGEPLPAFILYQPVYQNPDEETITGYAYAPFTARNLFEGIFGTGGQEADIGFAVYDQSVDPDTKLYESSSFNSAGGSVIQRNLHVAGRTWSVLYRAPDSIVSAANRRNPTITLIAGTIFSALIAGLVLSLLLARTRSLAFAENKELQRAKDDLLSIASHQLRTPATGVKQYVGMLLEGYGGKVTKKQKDLLQEAYNSNERQLGVIDEILHVARIDTGRLVLQKERLKVRAIIETILRDQNATIRQKSQKILTKFPKKILYASGDPQYVHMAVDNIISNAIKYTPEKGTITITIKRRGDFVAISVKDTGVGIEKHDLDQLFQKFSRIPNELSRQTAGSGVGLYISKEIIDLHGGDIEVDSQVGDGTTFTILLPLALRRKAES